MSCTTTRRGRFALTVLPILILGGGIVQQPTLAAIAVVGDVIPAYDSSDPWILAGDLYVGKAGYGALEIGGFSTSGVTAGRVAASNAVLGAEPTGEGFVSIIGQDSRLEVEQDLVVGLGGNAGMGVWEGGLVSTMNATVAQEAGSRASVTMGEENSLWNNLGRLEVGRAGDAEIRIFPGARLVSLSTAVAAAPDGTGTIVVEGIGARLESFNLDVGEYGYGSVRLEDGGAVSADHTILGVRSGGFGSATSPDRAPPGRTQLSWMSDTRARAS